MNIPSPSTWSSIRSAANGARANWRIGVIWIVATLIPTTIVTLPVGRILAEALDHSIFAGDWAKGLDLTVIIELVTNSDVLAPALGGTAVIAALVTVLLWPFLSAMVLTTAAVAQPAGFVTLLQGGARLYGRMLRMLLWSVVPFGIAGGIGGVAVHAAQKMGENAVLESTADHQQAAAFILLILLLIVAHISVEAGRAQFALDAARRSAVKAWWRGVKLIKSRPMPAFSSYLSLTIAGLLLMAVVGWVRINLPHSGLGGILIAFILTQVIVMAAVWMRTSRLLAMVRIAAPDPRG